MSLRIASAKARRIARGAVVVWPRSLAGQMASLIAIALFVAQAINLTLALRERAAFRLAQVARPAATRIADALATGAPGEQVQRDPSRLRFTAAPAIHVGSPRQPAFAAELRDQLRDLGIEAGRIDTGLRRAEPADWHRVADRRRARREPWRPEQMLDVAVEQPGGRWLALSVPWNAGGGTRLFWRLLAQTLVLYAVTLLPVLWIARRISRPLRGLAAAARGYAPRTGTIPLREEGPEDVRDVVTAFNALRLRVDAMLSEKDRMLGAIGHDLRTPLAALRVRVESVEDDGDRLRMAETIADMSRILDDILSLARLGHPSEPATPVDLTSLVDAVVEDFRDLGHAVEFAGDGRVLVQLRPSLMRRAVRNLVENAVKYAGAAEVTLSTHADAICVEVADRGPGIPTDRLDDVLGAFTRLEGSRSRDTGGIGLGLALARAIAEEAGGRIELSNRAGGGLLAALLLPRGSRRP